MKDETTKITANRQRKIAVVAGLSEKLAKSKAIIFTNYTGVTHKQLETLKKAIKPMDSEYVVAKNSLVLRALDENKIKLEGDNPLEGPTGTLLVYGDVVAPLKQLAKTIKELGLLNVKLGVMENKLITGEQVLKISTLPSRETLLTQIAIGLKSPISGLHRALIWNLQKLVMTLGAVAKTKPATAGAKVEPKIEAKTDVPVVEATIEVLASEPVAEASVEASETEPITETPTVEAEPETILAETVEEKKAEEPAESNSVQKETENTSDVPEMNTSETASDAVKSEGGEN